MTKKTTVKKQHVFQQVYRDANPEWIDLGVTTTSTGKSGLFLSPKDFAGELLVEKEFAGLLIGKGGATIRKIEAKLGRKCRVVVCISTSELSRDEELRKKTKLSSWDFSARCAEVLRSENLTIGVNIHPDWYEILRKKVENGGMK